MSLRLLHFSRTDTTPTLRFSFVEGVLCSYAHFLGCCEAPRLCNWSRCSTLAYVTHLHPGLAAVLSGANNFANISKNPFLVVLWLRKYEIKSILFCSRSAVTLFTALDSSLVLPVIPYVSMTRWTILLIFIAVYARHLGEEAPAV